MGNRKRKGGKGKGEGSGNKKRGERGSIKWKFASAD